MIGHNFIPVVLQPENYANIDVCSARCFCVNNKKWSWCKLQYCRLKMGIDSLTTRPVLTVTISFNQGGNLDIILVIKVAMVSP